MTRRLAADAAFTLARCLQAGFFLATSLYAALTYSTFTYRQFIAPREIDWIFQFTSWHHGIYWEVFCITVLTLVPRLTAGRGRWLAWAYVVTGTGAGIWITLHPPLSELASSSLSLWVAGAALVPIWWIGAIDHLDVWRSLPARASVDGCGEALRRWRVCLATAVFTWLVYASIAVVLRQTAGIHLTVGEAFAAGGWSGVVQVLAFTAVFQVLLIGTLLSLSPDGAVSPRTDYLMRRMAVVVVITAALQRFVWASFSFPSTPAWALSTAVAVAMTITWSGIALRWTRADGTRAGVAIAGLILLPAFAFGAPRVVASLDWDFALQKLSVVLVWLVAAGCIDVLMPAPRAVKATRFTRAISACRSAIPRLRPRRMTARGRRSICQARWRPRRPASWQRWNGGRSSRRWPRPAATARRPRNRFSSGSRPSPRSCASTVSRADA